jgi:thioredoxin reductase (NADPH)
MTDSFWDCAIIGAGPAGMTAATYLGRFLRRTLLIDDGESRMRRIPTTHNVPGFPDGIAGEALYLRLRAQAERYGALLRKDRVERILSIDGGFQLSTREESYAARTILLATGSQMSEPDVDGLDEGVARGVIRYCPICDGYEARGRRIAVLAGRPGAISEAVFLRRYSDSIALFWTMDGRPTPQDRRTAEQHGIEIGEQAIHGFQFDQRGSISLGDGRGFDVVYVCLGCAPRSALAASMGARLSGEGGVIVDPHQRTSAPGLYAAGDVLQGLDQIASACGQAAIAATAMHNDLRAWEGRP